VPQPTTLLGKYLNGKLEFETSELTKIIQKITNERGQKYSACLIAHKIS
jgi:hypothetical protein